MHRHDAINWHSGNELRKVEARAAAELSRLSSMNTLREVIQATVIVPGYLRVEARTLPGMKNFKRAQEDRAEALVEQQLKELSAVERPEGLSDDEFRVLLRQKLGQLREREWRYLQGHLPQLLQTALRRADTLIHRLGKPPY